MTFEVKWEVEVDAPSYQEAARIARTIQHDPDIPTSFEINTITTPEHKVYVDFKE